MPRCTVSNGPHSLTVEADSLYAALHSYDTHIRCGYPDAQGIPLPARDALLEVTVEGKPEVYRTTLRAAWYWSNRKSAATRAAARADS